MDKIGKEELVALRKLASELLACDDEAIGQLIAMGTLMEVVCDEKAIP